MKHKTIAVILLTLIALTFIALFVFHQGLYKTINVDLKNPEVIEIVTDLSQGGEEQQHLCI